MWSWPMPDVVPWALPVGDAEGAFKGTPEARHIELRAPQGTAVYAVEAGVVSWVGLGGLGIKGGTGEIHYNYLWVPSDTGLHPGDQVRRGDLVGYVSSGFPHATLGIALEQEGKGIDPTPYLKQAWSRVTDRFHRDMPKPPETKAERRELVLWLLNHPLWTHSHVIRMPPEDKPDAYFGKTVKVGNMEVVEHVSDGPDWHDEDVGDGCLQECMDLDLVYVDPTTESIVDDETRNTDFRVWIEAGGWYDRSQDSKHEMEPKEGWDQYNKWGRSCDLRLNCGGATMEDALIQLALRVKFYYGDTGREWVAREPDQCEGHFEGPGEEHYVSGCVDAGDGFCKTCGYLIRPEKEDE